MTPTIDAHQHFWERGRYKYEWLDAPALKPISGHFLPEDLLPLRKKAGVDRTVFVQTQHDLSENRWVLDLAGKHEWIAGVVGWIDLRSVHCEEQLLEFRSHPKFVGVRHITQDEPDDDWIVNDSVLWGLKVLEKHRVPFDLLFYVKHLKHATTLARKLPELKMVIDHLAKPRIKDHVLEPWKEAFLAASKFPNVFCKLSGLVTEADWKAWTVADLRPYVHLALEAFGPDRCMFGSDWPVSALAAPYERVHGALLEALGPLPAEDLEKIMGGTAIRFYNLKV
jgi:L-fuconolactonase